MIKNNIKTRARTVVFVLAVVSAVMSVSAQTDGAAGNVNDHGKLRTEEHDLAGGAKLVLIKDVEYDAISDASVIYGKGRKKHTLTDLIMNLIIHISPDKKKLAITNMDFEGDSEMSVFDVMRAKESKVEIKGLPDDYTSKEAIWLDNNILLVIAGYKWGTVSLGGDIYYYNVSNGASRKIVARDSDKFEIMALRKRGDAIEFDIYFLDNNPETMLPRSIKQSQIRDIINGKKALILKSIKIAKPGEKS